VLDDESGESMELMEEMLLKELSESKCRDQKYTSNKIE